MIIEETTKSMWHQQEINLKAKKRGFHLITAEIVDQLDNLQAFQTGILHLFIQHSSASICINENADPDVRHDVEAHFNQFVPENAPYYKHTLEGSDDMPAHIKSITVGSSLSIPISMGRLNLGTWQGIYLGEHRNQGGSRRLVATIHGDGLN